MNADKQENPLSRWSRRKLEAKQAEAVKPVEVAEVDTAEMVEVPVEEAVVLTDADMPDLDSLDEHSDFTGFMSPGVSDKLRNLALRKLFSGSEFNIRDGLDEYDEDYTFFEKLGDIVTCDMKHHIEMDELRKREKEEEAEEAEKAAAAAEDEAESDDQPESGEAPAEDEVSEEDRQADAPATEAAAVIDNNKAGLDQSGSMPTATKQQQIKES